MSNGVSNLGGGRHRERNQGGRPHSAALARLRAALINAEKIRLFPDSHKDRRKVIVTHGGQPWRRLLVCGQTVCGAAGPLRQDRNGTPTEVSWGFP
jgi:hypothetical protein